jgi:hypothetical protein
MAQKSWLPRVVGATDRAIGALIERSLSGYVALLGECERQAVKRPQRMGQPPHQVAKARLYERHRTGIATNTAGARQRRLAAAALGSSHHGSAFG